MLTSVKPKTGRGGKRPGAGRKPIVRDLNKKAIEYCEAVMADPASDPKIRLEAAKTLLRYSPPVAADKPAQEGGKWAELLK